MTPQPHLIKLANGLTFILQPIPQVNSVTVNIAVGAGPRYETKETAGLAHFLEHMLFEGTKKLPTAKDVAHCIERIGGRSGAWTDKEYVIYNTKVSKSHLKTALKFLDQILFNSTLNPEGIEKEKRIIAEELERKIDNPAWENWDQWFEWTWGKNQPLGRSIIGYIPTIKATNQTKLKEYLDLFYHPANMVLAIVGNFDTQEAEKYVQEYFGKYSKKPVPKFKRATFAPKKIHTKISKADTNQCQLFFGVVTNISHTHKDRFPITLLANILGGGFGARLFHKLTYELALAYTSETSNVFFSDTGVFYIQGGFDQKNLPKIIKVILGELKLIQIKKIAAGELNEAKERAKSQIYFYFENSDSVAYWYAKQQLLENRITIPEEMAKMIDEVTANDIQRVARQYFKSQNFSLLVRGPQKPKIGQILESYLNKF